MENVKQKGSFEAILYIQNRKGLEQISKLINTVHMIWIVQVL